MLFTVLSSVGFRKERSMMQIFPASMERFWENWELRFTVVLSLILQSSLFVLGNKRKYCTRTSFRITLWFAFLLADWLATVSIGVLLTKQEENKDDFVEPKSVIISLWAPILLIHLGGSDTITAYSMEDNELWRRRFLVFVFQFFVAVYIFLRAWTNTGLNVLAIPIFIVGVIKMGERIWFLWSASSQQFKESLFPAPDPGPNYARYMESYISASSEGFRVSVASLESPIVGDHTYVAAEANIIPLPQTDTNGPANVKIAHKFLKTFKRLFADLILRFDDVIESRKSLLDGKGNEVFQVMEIELGYMYDLFYTKARVLCSFTGIFLRLVTLSCNVSVLSVFFGIEKHQYPKVEVLITYVLLLGAIILEIYSVISLLSSDWTKLCLIEHKNKVTSMMMRFTSSKQNKRWSNSIGQFNLISFCFKAKQRCSIIDKIFSVKIGLVQIVKSIYQSFQKYWHTDVKVVDGDLKTIVFDHFAKKISEVKAAEEEKKAEEIKEFCKHRGDKVLKSYEHWTQLGWSVDVEFDQSILLWHIATDLLYVKLRGINADNGGNGLNYREASKLLSEYMLFLLVMRPSMLPNGIGEIRFQDTCAEATEFVKDRESIKEKKIACQMLLEVSKESERVVPSQVKGDKSKSVLFDACRLATCIEKLRINDEDLETEKRWELIAQVWVEMLSYAAAHCQGIQHAQQLRHGGEFITHVWLLMAHLGITDQFQISKGYARTRLIRR